MSSVIFHQEYWMRSYSETRWAAVMDSLELRWLYEHKIYQTRHGSYLPDFFLYGANIYVEVKGACPTRIEIEKAADVQDKTGNPVVFAWGSLSSDMHGINGAKLSFIKREKIIHIDSNEFSPFIEYGLGPKYFYKFLNAGAQRAYSVRPAAEKAYSMFFDLLGREGMEKNRADHHAILNDKRLAISCEQTTTERAVKDFLEVRLGRGMSSDSK
ncbi:hypothetical protein [Pseudomonas nitroreducens]|uniref:hypothetical protein n=1 Tax=Pseudomonas nitroreducens TaxID=46680 RepID=UPI002D7E2500|nr:hypothetical protein [Pseudomonas nitroreducens]